jgi:5-keto 4-deoxyuronate isomerase
MKSYNDNEEISLRHMPRPHDVGRMTTVEIRQAFLVGSLMNAGKLYLQFTSLDRLALGGIVPAKSPLELANHRETGRASFLERREFGAINTGGLAVATAIGAPFLCVSRI